MFACANTAMGQKDKDEEPTSWIYFSVIKDDNGKPVRNAAVIMHPVYANGKQSRGGMELKTDADGKANFDGIPYGGLRVQVLAHGFQTYGDDFAGGQGEDRDHDQAKAPARAIFGVRRSCKRSGQSPKEEPPPPDPKKPN